MAGVCPDDSLIEDDNPLIQVPKRDLTCLLIHVISAKGEIERMRYERNQLENIINSSSEKTASQEMCDEDGSQFNTEMATDRNNKMKTSSINNLKHTVLGGTQAQAQGLNARDSMTFMHYKEGDKSKENNFFDFGFENKNENLTDIARTRKTFRTTFSSDPMKSFSTSKEENSSGANLPGKSDSLLRTIADHGIECDAASVSLESPNKNAGISGSSQIQSDNYQKSHLYNRTLSSRQDERTAAKNRSVREMTKTGSHDSYFPVDSKFTQPFSKFNYSQRGRSNISPVSPVMTQKQDNLLTSAFSRLISRNILDCVTRELKRVKAEYHKLEEQYKEITKMQWHKEEEIKGLKEEMKGREEEITLLKVKLEELENSSKELSWTKSDEEEKLRIMLFQTHIELESEKKRNAKLENMLNDERIRFNRDEEQLKKQVENLKRRLHSQ